MRFLLRWACLLLMTFCASAAATDTPAATDRVLFVGNSLTYVGNVPAVYAALAAANGHHASSDMIVKGGATLSQRVADGSVARALEAGRYTALVLQERGGDLACAFGPQSCVDSRAALQALAELARQRGVTVVLLGTFQALPAMSGELVERESAAAQQAGIAYVEVSEKLRRARASHAALGWYDPDGMHPGKDLALLDAMLVYQALHGSLPAAAPLRVQAPIYGPASGLTETLRAADAPAPLPGTPCEVRYGADTIGLLGGLISSPHGG